MDSEIPDSLKYILEDNIDENFEPTNVNTLTTKQVIMAIHFIQQSWYDLCKQRQKFEKDRRKFTKDIQRQETITNKNTMCE